MNKNKTSTASKTATSTKTATKTSTEAYTQGNITVTGGAGAGHTTVHIGNPSGKGNKVDNKKPTMTQRMNKAIGGK